MQNHPNLNIIKQPTLIKQIGWLGDSGGENRENEGEEEEKYVEAEKTKG